MSSCGERAILVITKSIEGTTTNVVSRRSELSCTLEAGHAGEHRDASGERWQSSGGPVSTVLRHESDEHG
jgi:hypothetical protein